MRSPRLMFHVLAASLATLLLWAAPTGIVPAIQGELAYAGNGGAVQPPKQKLPDPTTRRPRHTASLEEFFEIDDDAEQYWKPLPVLARAAARKIGPPAAKPPRAYRDAPPAYRAGPAYPTGPPCA